MGRPKKDPNTKLQNAPLSLIPSVRAEAQTIASREQLSESEVLRLAVEAGLPLVPKRLARKRRAEARAAERTKRDEAAKPPASRPRSSRA